MRTNKSTLLSQFTVSKSSTYAISSHNALLLLPILSITAAARIGSWPKLEIADLVKPALYTFGAITLLSSFAGISRYKNYNFEKEKNEACNRDRQLMELWGEAVFKKFDTIIDARRTARDFYWLAGVILPISCAVMRYKKS